jgi:hypothetical protein
VTGLILLARMLTTGLDKCGSAWIRSPVMWSTTRQDRRSWTMPDDCDLATDKKAFAAGRRHKGPGWVQFREWPAEHTCPPLQPQA